MVGAMFNAAALLSKDPNLEHLSSAFSLFVSIKSWKARVDEAAYKAGLAGILRAIAAGQVDSTQDYNYEQEAETAKSGNGNNNQESSGSTTPLIPVVASTNNSSSTVPTNTSNTNTNNSNPTVNLTEIQTLSPIDVLVD